MWMQRAPLQRYFSHSRRVGTGRQAVGMVSRPGVWPAFGWPKKKKRLVASTQGKDLRAARSQGDACKKCRLTMHFQGVASQASGRVRESTHANKQMCAAAAAVLFTSLFGRLQPLQNLHTTCRVTPGSFSLSFSLSVPQLPGERPP